MLAKTDGPLGGQLPEGILTIPIHHASVDAPLRLCLLARQAPDPVVGPFIRLRELPDATVYLGCVSDAAGAVRELIELWIQNTDGLEASLPGLREAFSNDSLDRRWREQSAALAALDPAAVLRTGWEERHPPPLLVDLSRRLVVQPGAGESAGGWELCRDDAVLEAGGLPTYHRSLSRYLWRPQEGAGGRFVPVTGGAPRNGKTIEAGEAFGAAADLQPLNPQGGLMRVSVFSPLGVDEYADLLGGKPWKGIEQGKKAWTVGGVYAELGDWDHIQQSGAFLFLGPQGRAGRWAETFHLKAQLLTDLVRCVRSAVEAMRLPLLNLGAESFRVRLQPLGAQLPYFWTARAALVRPGEAHALPVGADDARYFVRTGSGGTSIYLPEGLSAPLQGTASVRLRQVLTGGEGRATVEGTLVLEERQVFSPHDLFWIRLPLATGRVDLYGHLYAADSLARGEVRFRTVEQLFGAAAVRALKVAEGAAFPRTPFEVVPLLSSACDLYSLGVLGARVLLVNEQSTLATALDELLSLARQVGAEYTPDRPLRKRVRAAVEQDRRFLDGLGPHRLLRAGRDPLEGFAHLPADLWYEALGALVRLFPGVGPDSLCKDFGDAPAQALEAVFNEPLAGFERLVIGSRSLIVNDSAANREIRALLASRRGGGGAVG